MKSFTVKVPLRCTREIPKGDTHTPVISMVEKLTVPGGDENPAKHLLSEDVEDRDVVLKGLLTP